MGSSWPTHELLMDYPQKLMSYAWATHRLPLGSGKPVGYPRETHGMTVACPWDDHGMPMGYPWTIHGLPMDYLSATGGLPMGCPWATHA